MELESLLYLLVSTCCAVPTAVLAVYFGFFFSGLAVGLGLPVNIDYHGDWHTPPALISSPLISNVLLLLIFPLQHTFMLRGPLSTVLNLVIPKKYFRPVYCLASGLAAGVVMYFWQPMTYVVWSVHSPTAANLIMGLSVLSYVEVVVSILTLDFLALDIIGLKGALMELLGWKAGKPKLAITGLYRLMRHPAYTGVMLALWVTPTMTIGHLLFSIVLTLYMILAVRFSEEPALLREMGTSYAEYMQTTPCFVPSLTSSQKSKHN